jgi:hypothetical protein
MTLDLAFGLWLFIIKNFISQCKSFWNLKAHLLYFNLADMNLNAECLLDCFEILEQTLLIL